MHGSYYTYLKEAMESLDVSMTSRRRKIFGESVCKTARWIEQQLIVCFCFGSRGGGSKDVPRGDCSGRLSRRKETTEVL